MPVTTYNDAVVIPHAPDWRQPVEWSRSWDTRIESAVTGSESRVGMRLKPRQRIRFRLVPQDLTERRWLADRLRAAAKAGRAIVPHWGRGLEVAANASGKKLSVTADGFQSQPGDVLFIHRPDLEGFNLFDLAVVVFHENKTIHLADPLSRAYPAGARVYPTILGKVTLGELEALDDWRQAVSVEVLQLQTVPDIVGEPPIDPEPEGDPGLFEFDYWFHGAPLPRMSAGGDFDHWLQRAPLVSP